MARLRQMGGDDGQVVDPIGRGEQLPLQQGPLPEPGPEGPGGPGGPPETGNPTSPREEPGRAVPRTPLSGGMATPPMPMVPTPQAGSSGPAMPPPPEELHPFQPLPSPGPGAYASPKLRGLFGGAGGLTEGGLGVPGGGQSQGPDQLSALIQQLLSNKGY